MFSGFLVERRRAAKAWRDYTEIEWCKATAAIAMIIILNWQEYVLAFMPAAPSGRGAPYRQ
jgi:hypothetical protein